LSDTQLVQVNVTDGEAYINGQSQGNLSLWAPPLLTGGTVYSGSAFINGTAYDSLANVTAYPSMNLGIPITTPSGVTTGPYDVYQVTPALIGYGTHSSLAWENITLTGTNGGTPITFFPMSSPTGLYDYYNGLGIEISLPQYPIDETVCHIEEEQALDCQVVTYATTLGGFFRSATGVLNLESTNIPLDANQPGSTNTTSSSATTVQSHPANMNGTTLFTLALVTSVVAISGSYLLYSRRSRRGTKTR